MTCSICLESFTDRASLNNCAHNFCKLCIQQWAEGAANTCPLCKEPFTEIRTERILQKRKRGAETEIIKVRPKKLRATYDTEEIRRLIDGIDVNDEPDGCVVGDDEEIVYDTDIDEHTDEEEEEEELDEDSEDEEEEAARMEVERLLAAERVARQSGQRPQSNDDDGEIQILRIRKARDEPWKELTRTVITC